MTQYIPPNSENILFNFSTGYTKPDFENIDIVFSNRATQLLTSDLKSYIEVIQLYQDTTYTYVKECRKIVVGYTSKGIQTLSLPCSFGGIRDIGASLNVLPPNVNLAAFLTAQETIKDLYTYFRFATRSTLDLASRLKIFQRSQSDLGTWSRALYKDDIIFRVNLKPLHKGVASFGTYSRATERSNAGFYAYARFFKGSAIEKDLIAYIKDIQPSNLPSFLNVIEIRDLMTSISGEFWKGQSDFYASFFKVYYRATKSIGSSIHGWATLDLFTNIRSWWKKDLSAPIVAGFFGISKNLESYLSCILPVNLSTDIHGYDTLGLKAFSIMGFKPNDLPSYISVVDPVDLKALIRAYKKLEATYNLPGYIWGSHAYDLQAFIGVNAALNLQALIDAVGKYLDLEARIAPRTINIKRTILISLKEHLDLRAVINFNCLKSSTSYFSTTINTIYKKDLSAFLIGWFGNSADNVIDLAVHINRANHATQDVINISGIPNDRHLATHSVSFDKERIYRQVNLIPIDGSQPSNLKAYVTGILTTFDFTADITARPLANFTTVPSWMRPKTYEAVFNINRFEERWVRFVELMFFTNSTTDFHYFYVSGEDKIYKIDKNRTWKIYVTGYEEDSESIFDRLRVRKKFIFDISKYNSVDAAIRDMIDRVTLYRQHNLAAYINPSPTEHLNLNAHINSIYKSFWSTSLKSIIKGYKEAVDTLSSDITGEYLKAENNLTASIVGKSYEPPEPDEVRFIFENPGYISAVGYNNMNWTYKQAEKYWIYDED